MDSKFATLELQSSITHDAANPDAVDKSSPLPFLDWVKYFADVSTDPSFLLKAYKNYVNDWFSTRKASITENQNIVQNLYVSLFRNIALNYLTQEERRFINNVNLSRPSEIAILMPLLVRKIKDICLYFASQRETVKHSTFIHNLKGSNFSLGKIVSEALDNSFSDPKINKLFSDHGITKDTIKSKLSFEIEPLYDLETNYYDINPAKTGEDYNATGKRLEYFNANSYEFNPDLFVNFDVSVVQAIERYPVILQELGTNFSVNLDFTAQDLQYLKDEDFTSLVNDLDTNNLRLRTLKESLQHFSGSTFYYLSTNADRKFTYGQLFQADTFVNYLNRRFPTVASVESEKFTTKPFIGGFFTPDKQGILNFLSFGLNGSMQSLSADHVYVFPDPLMYGNISGLSQTKLDTPFIFSENVSVLKNSMTNSYSFGRALTDFLTKFRGYQSRSETLNCDAIGVSRVQDPQEFFTGSEKTKWANADVYPPIPYNTFPIAQRQETLLQNLYTKTLYQHKTDIYNNEFAFYKEIYPFSNPQVTKNDENAGIIVCLSLDGGETFYTTASGYNYNYNIVDADNNQSGVTTYTGGLTSLTSIDYFLQSILLYPEQDFYRTTITYNILIYDCQNFNAYPAEAVVTVLSAETFVYEGLTPLGMYSYIHSASSLDCGPFVYNGEDATYADYDRSLIEHNLVLGSTLSSAETTLYNISGNLTKEITLYNQQQVYGDLYFRNYNNSTITAASAVLSGLFAKYSSAITDQIFSQLKHFDLIADTAIFETENYLLFERLVYDYDTSTYLPQPSERFYIYKPSTTFAGNSANYLIDWYQEYNHFSNTWYNEKDDTILVARTNLVNAPYLLNDRRIDIDLFLYNFSTLKQIGLSSIASFSLSAMPMDNVNLINIEKPLLNYNPDTGSYVVKFLAKDPSHAFFDTTISFKMDNNRNVYNISTITLYPNMFIFSNNFAYQTFGGFQYRSLDNTTAGISFSGNSLVIN